MASLYTVGLFYLFIGAGGGRIHMSCKPAVAKMLANIGSKTYEIYLMQKLVYAFPVIIVLNLPIHSGVKLLFCVSLCGVLGFAYEFLLRRLEVYSWGWANIKKLF